MADKYNDMCNRDQYEPYQRAAALIYYRAESGYSAIPRALKYRGNFAAGRHFASMLGKRLAESPLFADVDLVVPVPLHWMRRLRRGYNQAEVIAREVARELEAARGGDGASAVAFEPRLLRRTRFTKTQTRLGAEAKRLNVAGAFAVRRGIAKKWREEKNSPRHILLVDDVFTSGSTLATCHAALRTVFGPEVRIRVATLAFAG